jgi:predicted Fe-S protein YdhL (DUF1289 family)
VGCYRSIAEIAGWQKYSAQQKLAVLGELARRRQAPSDRLRSEVSPPSKGKLKQCGRCGTGFVCCAQETDARCWCDSLPHIMPLASLDERCLCPQCLAEAINTRLGAPPNAAV